MDRRDGELLCYELELPGAELGYTPRHYDEIHMYFGAVQAGKATALRQFAADVGVPGQDAGEEVDGGMEAQHLVDGAGDQ